ncbi:hypothetical protein D3C73_1202680 [compost metagenome]
MLMVDKCSDTGPSIVYVVVTTVTSVGPYAFTIIGQCGSFFCNPRTASPDNASPPITKLLIDTYFDASFSVRYADNWLKNTVGKIPIRVAPVSSIPEVNASTE